MSSTNGLARAVERAQDGRATEPQVRPKVMRRPAQFGPARSSLAEAPAASPSRVDELVTPPVAALPTVLAITTTRSWQEDAPFGIVLLVAVVLVNLGLILWLPHLSHGVSFSAAELATSSRAGPGETSREAVTLYHTSPSGDTTEPSETNVDSALTEPTPLTEEDMRAQSALAAPPTPSASIHILGAAPSSPTSGY